MDGSLDLFLPALRSSSRLGSLSWNLGRFSLSNELYSHILLIPFISTYLVWIRRLELPAYSSPHMPAFAFFSVAAAATLLLPGLHAWLGYSGGEEDTMAFAVLPFILFFVAACALFVGRRRLRRIVFPLVLLFLMIPFPTAFVSWLESFLQRESAASAYALFRCAGTPVFFHDLVIQLPGISLEVAPQCSGIHSSIALLITSLIAGYLFLESTTRRIILTAIVIPLAILRNGLRVFTIGELCVHIGPEMINSELHRHGGPLFFALSLVPFFAFLYFLKRSEDRVMTRARAAG